jgi:hypothetical protein
MGGREISMSPSLEYLATYFDIIEGTRKEVEELLLLDEGNSVIFLIPKVGNSIKNSKQ